MKRLNKKGFTMAELLIVVAIIAVLVAIAIPVFTKQLHKAQDATDVANIRAFYAEQQSKYLLDGKDSVTAITTATNTVTINDNTITLNNLTYTMSVDDKGVHINYSCSDTTDAGNGTF